LWQRTGDRLSQWQQPRSSCSREDVCLPAPHETLYCDCISNHRTAVVSFNFDMHQDSHGPKSAKRSVSFVPPRYLDGGPLGRSLVNQRGQFIEGPWILFISELLVQHWGSKLDCLPSKGGVIRFAKKGRPFQCTIFPRSHDSHPSIGTA